MLTLTLDAVVERIRQMHETMMAQAVRAVNTSLTLRNWAIGFYIEEYERGGADRSQYGDRLMDELAERLTRTGLSNCNRRQLYRYRDFYRGYPGIVGTASPQFRGRPQRWTAWRRQIADSGGSVSRISAASSSNTAQSLLPHCNHAPAGMDNALFVCRS